MPRARLWSSLSLRFNGFTANLEALLAPLNDLPSRKLARIFFTEKLPEIVELVSRHPQAAQRIVAGRLDGTLGLTKDLILIACGDGSRMAAALDAIEESQPAEQAALGDCLLAVFQHRPQEGRHLMAKLFERAEVDVQLRLLEGMVTRQPVEKRFVGECFLKMMEGSTPEERLETIYPRLDAVLAKARSNPSSAQAFLSAIYRGWLSECPLGHPQLEGS